MNYIDVEISWPDGSVAFSEWGNGDVTSTPVGQVWSGWVLAGYYYKGDSNLYTEPLLFDMLNEKVEHKATCARFIKLESK